MLIDRLRPALSFEKLASLRQDLLLVLPNLHRVNAVFLGNFVQRLQAPDGFDPDLRLQVGAWNLSFDRTAFNQDATQPVRAMRPITPACAMASGRTAMRILPVEDGPLELLRARGNAVPVLLIKAFNCAAERAAGLPMAPMIAWSNRSTWTRCRRGLLLRRGTAPRT